ncbi:putative eukaryotic translation initiation factor 4 gamma like protein [Dictyocoela muelleri]|nr:putative eukaryotic translation initiation factor 4 gamma like protein [Dictyocoela muelleri]
MEKKVIYNVREPLMVIDETFIEQQKNKQFMLISKDGVLLTKEMMAKLDVLDDSEDEEDLNKIVEKEDIEIVLKNDNIDKSKEIFQDKVQDNEIVQDKVQDREIVQDKVQDKEILQDKVQDKEILQDKVQDTNKVEDTIEYDISSLVVENEIVATKEVCVSEDVVKEIDDALKEAQRILEELGKVKDEEIKVEEEKPEDIKVEDIKNEDVEIEEGEIIIKDLNKEEVNKEIVTDDKIKENIVDDDLDDEFTIKNYKDYIKDDETLAEIAKLQIKSLVKVDRRHALLDSAKMVYQINEIFAVKERSSVKIELDKSIFKDFKPSRKRLSPVEVFRYELNTLALSNYENKVFKLKNIDGKDDDFRQMADIIYEKAIEEPTFAKIYAMMVKELRPSFRTQLEKKNKTPKTIFLSKILKNCEAALMKKQNWDLEIQFADETARENYIVEMQKSKNRVLGTIRFISYLFIQGIIPYSAIESCFKHLLATIKDSESVETICQFVVEVAEKFIFLGKYDVLNKYVSKLKECQNNYDKRIYYMILDTEEKVSKLLLDKSKAGVNLGKNKDLTNEPKVRVQKNTFSGLINLKKRESIANKPNNTTNDEKVGLNLKKYIRKNLDENFPDGKEHLYKEFIKQSNPEKFLESFVFAILEELGSEFDRKMEFFFEVAKSFRVNLIEIIDKIDKEEYQEILCDSPFAKQNYEKLKQKACEFK